MPPKSPTRRSASPAKSPAKSPAPGAATRDARGLIPSGPAISSEAEARARYYRVYGKLTMVQAPVIAALVLGLLTQVPGQSARLAARLAFVHEHDLGAVLACWYIVYSVRLYMNINANGARAPARVDRPDQHLYQVAGGEDAPYVFMAEHGAAGRFNRAQRAAFHMDESLALFLSSLLVVAALCGPLGLGIGAVYAFGRVNFAEQYKASVATRMANGTMYAIFVSEHLAAALVGGAALKGLLGPALPFF